MVAPLIVLGGYLLGSAPFGYWVVRLVRHEDVRTKGSGNIGATNVWRVYGRKLGIPVILLDIAKGLVPALVGLKISGELTGVLAGAAAMAGHWRPLYLGFTKGGRPSPRRAASPSLWRRWRRPASSWLPGSPSPCSAAIRSVASIVAALLLPVFIWVFGGDWPVVTFGALTARRRAPATQREHATPDRRDREPVPLPPGRAA